MKKLFALFAAAIVSACASQPDEIHTAQVSDLQYLEFDCDQLHSEAGRVSDRANDLRRTLQETADNDAAQVGVGLILFWPALFLVEGGDGAEANEYSRLKGEKEAIERVAIHKKCDFAFAPAPTLQAAVAPSGTEPVRELEIPRPGDEVDGRLLVDLLKGNTAKGSLYNCDLGGNTSREDFNDIEIQFSNTPKANVRVKCSYSHGVAGFVDEDMDVTWQIKGSELCFLDVPKNASAFVEECSPVVFAKTGFEFNPQRDGAISFVLQGSGLPASTAQQLERSFKRVKSPS